MMPWDQLYISGYFVGFMIIWAALSNDSGSLYVSRCPRAVKTEPSIAPKPCSSTNTLERLLSHLCHSRR